jgi:RHS repeat-associated protein
VISNGERIVAQVVKRDGDEDDQIYYHHDDALGSSLLITNENAEVEESNYYSSFGELIDYRGQDITNVGYTGHEYDQEYSFINMGGRIYDPELGRVLTPDPVIATGGKSPQGFNRYTYALNNPMRYVDPSGFQPALGTEGTSGGGTGGTGGYTPPTYTPPTYTPPTYTPPTFTYTPPTFTYTPPTYTPSPTPGQPGTWTPPSIEISYDPTQTGTAAGSYSSESGASSGPTGYNPTGDPSYNNWTPGPQTDSISASGAAQGAAGEYTIDWSQANYSSPTER